MGHGLAGFLARAGEPEAEDDVVQAGLEDAHQVFAGDAAHALGLAEVAAKLLLENAVDELGLLLLAQLDGVFAFLAAALRLTDGFLLAAVAQDDGINTELTAALENRSSINCHNYMILS